MLQLYMGTVVRVLLGFNGVLMLALAFSNVNSIMALGLNPESVFMTIFATLLAWICLWAAISQRVLARDN
jgi:hypothetical protein